ncbi:MAG: T9SS type A sorting domain-containing protein [Chitinophagales bacterium]|nr:T9SS type A sorting domain-containing protein [Chitinophagales bacterium]
MKNFIMTLVVLCTSVMVYSQVIPVTFNVDMSNYPGAFTTVYAGGTWNNFCGNCSFLTNQGGGLWSGTVPMDTTAIPNWPELEWKFIIDNYADVELFNGSESCVKVTGQFINRVVTNMPNGPAVLDLVCWNACVTCDQAPNLHNVKFQVDMSEYIESGGSVAAGVNVNGTFNGFCGTCWNLTDPDGDSIYSGTFLVVGDTMEYLYTIGNFADLEGFDAFSDVCTKTVLSANLQDTFTNRYTVLALGDTCLTAVCWEACEPCGAPPTCPIPSNLTASNFKSAGSGKSEVNLSWTPVAGAIHYTVQGGLQGSNPNNYTVVTVAGPFKATGLSEATYEWQIRSNCATGSSAFSALSTFTIPACTAAVGLNTVVNGSSATFSWAQVPAAIGYIFDAGTEPGSYSYQQIIAGGGSTSLTLNSIPTGNYKWRLRAGCSTSPLRLAPYSPTQFFTIAGATSKTDAFSDIMVLSPNPANTSLTISLSQEFVKEGFEIILSDLQGRLITTHEIGSQTSFVLDVSTYQSGIYMIQVRNGQHSYVEKLIIN